MLENISIENYASIKKPVVLNLGKINYIIGDNSSGKSAICQAIELLFDYNASDLARLSSYRSVIQGNFLNRFNNDVHVKRIIEHEKCCIDNDILEVNGEVTNDYAYLSSQFKVFLHETYSLKKYKTGIDIAKLCISNLTGWNKDIEERHFGILNNLIRVINENPYRIVENLSWENNNKLIVKMWGKKPIDYSCLSSGEQSEVCVEIFITLSEMFNEYKDVLIIFDDLPTKLVGNAFVQFVKRLESITKPNIQFLLTSINDVTRVIQPDCIIRIMKISGQTTVVDTIKRTPKGIKDIESKIVEKFINNEDEFINTLIIPLLYKMCFTNIHRVNHHGPGELGIDIGPFIGSGFEWKSVVLGAQVKAQKLDAHSGSRNNINGLIDEVKKAFNNLFYIDNLN